MKTPPHMRDQGRACITQSRNGFVTPASCDGLPRKPPVTNHCADQGRPLDTQVRAWQQTLLNMLRLLTKVHLHSGGLEPDVWLLHAQNWQVLAELYHKLLDYRRECSVPGVSSAHGNEEVLFSQDDLKMVKSVANINGM